MGRVLLVLLASSVLCGPEALGADGAAGDTVRVGLVARSADQPSGDMRRRLADGLKQVLGRPVEIVPFDSMLALVDAQAVRRVDVAFLSTAGFLAATKLCGCVEPLVAPRAGDGSLGYYAVVVTRRESPISGLPDLASRFVAAGPPESVATRRLQTIAITATEAMTTPEKRPILQPMGDDVAGIEMVVDGELDAAFAWSSLVGDEKSGFSRGTLRRMADAGGDPSELKIVWTSVRVPHGPVTVHASIGLPARDAARGWLERLADADPDLYDAIEPTYGGGFAPVQAKDYATLMPLAAAFDPLAVEAGPRPRPDRPAR